MLVMRHAIILIDIIHILHLILGLCRIALLLWIVFLRVIVWHSIYLIVYNGSLTIITNVILFIRLSANSSHIICIISCRLSSRRAILTHSG
jgi:hypothetical protein